MKKFVFKKKKNMRAGQIHEEILEKHPELRGNFDSELGGYKESPLRVEATSKEVVIKIDAPVSSELKADIQGVFANFKAKPKKDLMLDTAKDKPKTLAKRVERLESLVSHLMGVKL